MAPLHPLIEHLSEAWPPSQWRELSVVLAVSGGADSVALLRAVHALKTGGAGRVWVAHFNHQLRGADAIADEQFVRDLSHNLEVPCQVGRSECPQPADTGGDGLEAALRRERYEFLRATAERLGARYVVTAHTADDQAETILHRIMRGTGLRGLAGMRRARPLSPAVTLLRSLLGVRRACLVDYLTQLGQSWREDRTNISRRFTRNRIRHELLPLIERDYNSAVVEAILRLGTMAGEAQERSDRLATALIEEAVEFHSGQATSINCQRLIGHDRHLVRELFVGIWRHQSWPRQEMGCDQWTLLADMALGPEASCPGAKYTFPGAIKAQRKAAELTLTRL